MNQTHLTICYECPKRQHPCAGACVCSVNGKDITTNIQASACPLGKFGGIRGAGDVVAAIAKALHLGNSEECGPCAKRRAALNKAIPFRRPVETPTPDLRQ